MLIVKKFDSDVADDMVRNCSVYFSSISLHRAELVFDVFFAALFVYPQAAQVASFLHAQGVQPFMGERDIFSGPLRQPVPHCEAFKFRRAAESDEPKAHWKLL